MSWIHSFDSGSDVFIYNEGDCSYGMAIGLLSDNRFQPLMRHSTGRLEVLDHPTQDLFGITELLYEQYGIDNFPIELKNIWDKYQANLEI